MMKTYLMTVAALVSLAACADFEKEAGSSLDAGNFGNATMNNSLVQTGSGGIVINLQRRFAEEVDTTVNFAFNSAVLDAEAQATLSQQASWIKQFPEIRFKVFGHTDLVGSDSYNRALGLRRAQAAVRYLTSQGISRSRLEAVASFGETQPVVPTQDMERRNRRTVTEVSGFASNDRDDELNGKFAAVIFREYVGGAETGQAVSETTIGN